jgi:hypothetical protein
MATPDIRPNGDGEGNLGTTAYKWLKGWFGTVHTTSVTDGSNTATVANVKDAVDKKHTQGTDTGSTSNTFAVGDGADSTKTITANNADANKPALRYNHTGNEWEYSNDGTTFAAIGSGGGAGTDEKIKVSADDTTAGYLNGKLVAGAGITLTEGSGGGDETLTVKAIATLEDPRRAGSFDLPTANAAPLDVVAGTYTRTFLHRFDDTTEEFVLSDSIVPATLNTAGTVTFRARGRAITAAASRYIQLRFSHLAVSDSDPEDGAFTTENSGDLTTDATQGDHDIFEWTETVANLGWAAGDRVNYKVSRIAPSGTNLTGDWGLAAFTIVYPVIGA